MMHILFINQFFPPEVEPSATKVYEVGSELVRLGHQVKVITGFPNYPTGIRPPEYRGKLVQTEEWGGIQVLRTALFTASTSRFMFRTLSHFSFLLSSLLRSLGSGQCDVIICSSPPLEIALSGVLVSLIKHRPLVLEIRDLWPDEIIQPGYLRNPLLISVAKWVESIAYRRAVKIVPVSHGFVPYLVNEGVPDNKIEVNINGTDTTLFRPDASGAKLERKKLGLDSRFVAIYAGTHGLQHHLETVLEAANMLKSHSDIIFLLVGDGKEKNKLLTLQRKLSLRNVLFLPTQPRHRISRMIAAADVCLVHTEKILINTRNIQAKMFDYMASGCPIIVGADGQMRELIERASAGIFVGAENAQGMAKAILRLYNYNGLRKQLGENGRKYALKHFSRQIIAKQYVQLLEDVLCEMH